MNPIGIILVFLFLALLVILGVGLAGVGAFKLRQLARSGFATGATDGGGTAGGGSSESGQWAVVIMVSWQSALIAAGLFLTTYGALAGYRLIWGG